MTKTKAATIQTAITDLASPDGSRRKGARRALVEVGAPATVPLLEAFPRSTGEARRAILGALRDLADPSAADVFLAALDDEDGECRWIAAEGLVALGREGLLRVLRELTKYPDTEWGVRGAHQVLSGFRAPEFIELVEPVLDAFRSRVATLEVPQAALDALEHLRREPRAVVLTNPRTTKRRKAMESKVRVETSGDLVEVHVTGKLTKRMYEEFVPVIEKAIGEHGKLRLLFVMKDFHGWTAGALWDDLKFDLRHFRDISRLAIVGEKAWQQGMAVFCRPFTTAKIDYFEASALDEAREWLQQPVIRTASST